MERTVSRRPCAPLLLGAVAVLVLLASCKRCGAQSTCGNGVCDPGETCTSCALDCQRPNGRPCQLVGVFYSGWHLPAYNAVAQLRNAGQPVLTVEDVVRSRTPNSPQQYSIADMLINPGVVDYSFNMYYQRQPADDFYCIYHSRSPGELLYNSDFEGSYLQYQVPDCPNWQDTVLRHAQQLSNASVDFIIMDMSNLVQYDNTADAIQLRPLQILIEEWGRLRQQGIRTPDVAAFQRLPIQPAYYGDGGDWMYTKVLDLYNDAASYDMVLKEEGRMIWFVPDTDDFDENFEYDLQYNGGRNNIQTQRMWVNKQASQSWSFFDFCRDSNNNPVQYITDADCNQMPTQSIIGSQLAVSPSYQLTYASLPFQASGVYGGDVFRKQFKTAFQVQPDYLLLSSWNELTAAPLQIGEGPPMGLEDDPFGQQVTFTDTYAAEFGRDIEPTMAYGSLLYDIMVSCLRVYRSQVPSPEDPTQICDVPNELCCSSPTFSQTNGYYGTGGQTFGLYAGNRSGRINLYQCSGPAGSYVDTDPGCDGGGNTQATVGQVSLYKGGGTLRYLDLCGSPEGFDNALQPDCGSVIGTSTATTFMLQTESDVLSHGHSP